MEKDTKKLLEEIVAGIKWNENMPDRRKAHCDLHDRVVEMYTAVYGPPNKPEEGVLSMTKENTKFIERFNESFKKLAWFLIFGGLSSMATFLFLTFKMVVNNK